MNNYYFDLLGLHVLLQTPQTIQISQRLQPFVCQSENFVADCTIHLQYSGELPRPKGIWHGPECYDYAMDALQIYHCREFHGTPFAVTSMAPKGDIQITVDPAFAEYFSGTSGIFNRIGFENMLLQHNGLLLHASLIKFACQGIAFAGPSGAGKSTQAELWQKFLGADILNGDRAALRMTHEGWRAYGSPYAGTSGIYRNENAPLRAVVVLQQAKENCLSRLSGTQAFTRVWPELSLHRWDGVFVDRAMELCEKLLTDVPVYLLECLPDGSAVTLLKEGLSL